MGSGDVQRGAGCAMAGVAYPIMTILGAIIYVWTIVFAFADKGLFAAVLSLIFPVLAQLYWGFVIWNATGTIVNPYCLALIGYGILWVVILVGFKMADTFS